MNESVYSHVNLRSEETRWINLLSVRTKKRGCCREVAEARLYICEATQNTNCHMLLENIYTQKKNML